MDVMDDFPGSMFLEALPKELIELRAASRVFCRFFSR